MRWMDCRWIFLKPIDTFIFTRCWTTTGKNWLTDSVKTLIKHGFLKMKVMWGNHKSFITKKFKKAIMKRWALKKRANISNNPEIKKSILKNKETVLLI